jgi:hypothetical protein
VAWGGASSWLGLGAARRGLPGWHVEAVQGRCLAAGWRQSTTWGQAAGGGGQGWHRVRVGWRWHLEGRSAAQDWAEQTGGGAESGRAGMGLAWR